MLRALARRRRGRLWLAAIAVIVVIVAVLAYGFAETYWLQVKEYTFASPDLPPAFEGIRIALITDIHRGPFFSQGRVEALAERINTLSPDLILLGGDYVYLDTDYALSCFTGLKGLQAPLGCFAVLGNHDYEDRNNGAADPTRIVEAIQETDITLLRDQAVWVEKDGQHIRVGGVSDYTTDRPRLTSIVEGTCPGDFVLVVSHNPDYAEDLPVGVVDLVLSGHTHGGQITFFGLTAFHVPSKYGQKYRTGLVSTEATTVIVSNGVGTSTIPPIRLFARPQIVMLTLRSGPVANLCPWLHASVHPQ